MGVSHTESCDPRELVQAVWATTETPEPPDTFLHHALLATSCFSEHENRLYHDTRLRELLRLFKAERAFLFGIRTESDGTVEIEECSTSLDVDGDAIANADKKAPRDLIVESARKRAPFCELLGQDESGESRERSLLVLPACSREATICVIVLENRFKDLAVTSEALSTALIYCRSLAGFQDLANVVAENESLWRDLTRIRDESVETLKIPAVPRSRAPKPPKREGLKGDYSMIVGSSLKILDILQVIDRISGSTAPVLINGESGTGKELAAVAVHQNSPRSDKSFISENCGAITETLLESELFGYVRGAFTGANKDHKGLFELASGGTLFLDEIGDMSLSMQKKLLRVLQEGVIRRVGAKDFTQVDVRIISATNKDLLEECRAGNFREDLYYRVNVINILLPPLRERREDVPDLIEFFLREMAESPDAAKTIDQATMQLMVQYPWPGNIRELQNEVRKIATLCDGDLIGSHDLSAPMQKGESGLLGARDWTSGFTHMTLKEATEHLEKALIQHALDSSAGNKSLVAKTLQIPKTSLYNKIHKYDL
jgi:DNA-binding NtrC family response regulator